MINMGIVGAGYMGSLHARCAAENPRANLVGIVDSNESTGTSLAKSMGARYFATVESAFEAGIEAFVLATPDRLHVDIAVKILESGRSILLEKPMADTLEGAKAILAAAKSGRSRILVGQILRYDPRYAAAADAVNRGEIGEPVHVTAGRIGTQEIGIKLNGSSSVCFYIGVHDVDAIQWITRKRIERVYSRSVSKIMPNLGVDSEDAIFTTLELEGGAIGQLFNGWTRPSRGPYSIDGRMELVGTEGTIEIDARDHGLRILGEGNYRIPDGLHWPEVNGKICGDLAAEMENFLLCLETGNEFVVPVKDAMRAVAVNDAILRSVKSGQPELVLPID
jgi:predicted dehydrogenase